jgi:hypothetical protein
LWAAEDLKGYPKDISIKEVSQEGTVAADLV